MNIPPLPEGFEMISDTPPPPPGFEIIGQPKAQSAPPMSAWDRFKFRANDIPLSILQMADKALPENLKGTKTLTGQPARPMDQIVAQREATYRPPEGFDFAGMAGKTLPLVPLALATPAAATFKGAAGIGAASGAASGLLEPVTQNQDQFWTQKGGQAAVGGVAGGVLGPAAHGLSRVVSPQTREPVKRLMAEGVTPTPGQIMGGFAQRVEDKLTSVPILGDAITNARQAAVQDFNKAALNRTVAPIGGKVSEIGREGVDAAYTQLSSAYNNLLPKLTFKADQQFAQEFGTIQQMTQSLPPVQAQQFERIVRDKLFNKMTPAGLMNGESLKAAESELGRMARGYRGSQDYDARQLGDALASVQKSMRDALQRGNPQHAAELGRINDGYANYAIIRDAASRVGSREGVMTPAQLSGAVRAQDKSVGHGKFARDKARMQDLSDPGVSVLGAGYPDSGTTGRLLLGGGALGSALLEPTIPLALGAASVPYLPLARQGAAALLTKRPAGAEPIAEMIRRLPAGLLAPAFYQAYNN